MLPAAFLCSDARRDVRDAGRALAKQRGFAATAVRKVVGVVEDIQFYSVGENPALHVLVPWTQRSTGRPRLLVKGTGHAASMATAVRDVVGTVEPGTRIDQVAPLDALVSRATAQPRFTSLLVSAFGGLALVLAAVGIYGTLSYLVGMRTREIGIRLALGAPRTRIMSDVLARGLVPALAGGSVGLALAVAVARTFRALLFDVDPLDLGSFTSGAILLLLVALAAARSESRGMCLPNRWWARPWVTELAFLSQSIRRCKSPGQGSWPVSAETVARQERRIRR